jgi:hypothetical protein
MGFAHSFKFVEERIKSTEYAPFLIIIEVKTFFGSFS